MGFFLVLAILASFLEPQQPKPQIQVNSDIYSIWLYMPYLFLLLLIGLGFWFEWLGKRPQNR